VSDTPIVGFIGLGMMGKPMALNLLKAGYPLVVHNRSRGAVDELAAAGASPADSPQEVARRSDIILLCLPTSSDVAAVARREDGLFAGSRPGQIVMDHSTISPQVTRELGSEALELGVEWLDAPVSGGEIGAREATLSIMVGGSAEGLERVRPLLEAMGKTVVHMGPTGAGQTMKLANQVVCALHYAGLAEGLALAKQAGLDMEKSVRVLTGGYAYSRILEVRGPHAARGDYGPGVKVSLQLKDIKMALDAGRAEELPLPFTALAAQLFQAIANTEDDDLDVSVLMRFLSPSGR
jgi:2-hydroxy-3-oxopropionate reductase